MSYLHERLVGLRLKSAQRTIPPQREIEATRKVYMEGRSRDGRIRFGIGENCFVRSFSRSREGTEGEGTSSKSNVCVCTIFLYQNRSALIWADTFFWSVLIMHQGSATLSVQSVSRFFCEGTLETVAGRSG